MRGQKSPLLKRKEGVVGDYRYQGLARPLQSITIPVHAPKSAWASDDLTTMEVPWSANSDTKSSQGCYVMLLLFRCLSLICLLLLLCFMIRLCKDTYLIWESRPFGGIFSFRVDKWVWLPSLRYDSTRFFPHPIPRAARHSVGGTPSTRLNVSQNVE